MTTKSSCATWFLNVWSKCANLACLQDLRTVCADLRSKFQQDSFFGTFEGPGIYIYICAVYIYILYIYTRIYTRIYNRIHGFNEPNGPNESDEGTNRLGSNLLVDWTAEISPGGAGMENGHLWIGQRKSRTGPRGRGAMPWPWPWLQTSSHLLC